MAVQGPSTSVVADPSLVLGRFAGLLADGAPVADALAALVEGLGLRTAVLRTGSGQLLATAGDVLRAVPATRSAGTVPTLELPVEARGITGSLTVTGARPSQLPVLRTAATVLALALVPAAGPADLLDDAQADQDAIADALHDGPVQSLVVARYAADAAVRGGDPAMARDAVQQALVDLRRHLWHLRPRGAAGLTEALEQLSAQAVEAGGPALGLLAAPDAELAGREAVLAYRLVQTVAHGAGQVRVALRRDGSGVAVDVDGGSPLSDPQRWVRRARALGGDLTSSAGRLRLVLPLPSEAVNSDARTAP